MSAVKSTICLGLSFGDEGKGTVTDYLSATRNPEYVVRFSGGAQTAHNVMLPDGRHHTFRQFGSGTLQGIPTLISRYMMVNPLNMVVEARKLQSLIASDPFEKTWMSENALLTTPVHRAANRQREINRGRDAHGSCGQGIGETMSFAVEYPFDAPRLGDMRCPEVLLWKLDAYRKFVESELGTLDAPSNQEIVNSYAELLQEENFNIITDEEVSQRLRVGYNVFEGSQGVLLDEWLGFHPHTTWATTTAQYAQQLLHDAHLPAADVIGIIRTYSTRHGYGPFPSEFNKDFDWTKHYPELHNEFGQFQGAWRVGAFDLPLLDYAIAAAQDVTELAVTHCDISNTEAICSYPGLRNLTPSFSQDLEHQESLTHKLLDVSGTGIMQTMSTDNLLGEITQRTSLPIRITSYGKTWKDKVEN